VNHCAKKVNSKLERDVVMRPGRTNNDVTSPGGAPGVVP
jgi:hypothetical protein